MSSRGRFSTIAARTEASRTPRKFGICPSFKARFCIAVRQVGSAGFQSFCEMCRNAFCVLRRHAHLLITLLELMLPAGATQCRFRMAMWDCIGPHRPFFSG
jgi:hypothetical protein